MHPCGNLIVFVVALAGVVHGDRLENVHRKIPLTASYAGGHSSILSLPYNSIGEYKNSYKAAAANTYTTALPLLHKSHYPTAAASYNPSGSIHHDTIPIVKQAIEPNNGDGSYSYSYETANGISASEYGIYKPGPTNEEGTQSASGSFSYTGPDNVLYTITYTAGEEGFVPQGAHIPTPPPIPEAIQKILQYAGENTKNNRYEESNALNKYTSALPTPYSGYNPNYNKITSLNNQEYKVQDDYSRK